MSEETFDRWKALRKWRSDRYQDESVQSVFRKVGINYQVQHLGGNVLKSIYQVIPKAKQNGSDFIKLVYLEEVKGVLLGAKELIGLDWILELKPLSNEIEKCVARIEKIVSAVWEARQAESSDSSIQLDSLTSALEPTLMYLHSCIEAYIDPLELAIDRGPNLAPNAAAREADSLSTREFVRNARWAIEERRDGLEETLGFILEAYHWEREYGRFRKLPVLKRARPRPTFYPRIGDTAAKLEIIERAGKYLDLFWMQCRAATDAVLLAVLDTEFVPLDRKVQVTKHFIATDTLPRLVYLAVAITWIAYAFTSDGRIEWAGIALAVWVIFAPLFVREREARAAKLRSIRTEVATTAYDADGIAARLKRAEESGLVVPTIAYSLLKLRAQQQPH